MKSIITPYFKSIMVQNYISSLVNLQQKNVYLIFSNNGIPVIAIRVPKENITQGVKIVKLDSTTPKLIPYDKDVVNIHEKNFFGFSDLLYTTSVYKLLSGPGITVPSSTESGKIETSDGSTWKYMYSIEPKEFQKFTFPVYSEHYYLPVKQLQNNVYKPNSSNIPPGGHGSNTLVELFSSCIILRCDIPGKLFSDRLEYNEMSLGIIESDKDVLYMNYQLVGNAELKPGDTVDITEPGFKTTVTVQQVLSNGNCIISGDSEILHELYTRNMYSISKPGYNKIELPSVDESNVLTVTTGSLNTVEYKTSKVIITVINF